MERTLPHIPCPCCSTLLVPEGEDIHIKDVLSMWERNGKKISTETWREYSQFGTVKLQKCQKCSFGIFIPRIPGNNSFYKDITENDYYLKNRWDFDIFFKYFVSKSTTSLLDIGCGQGAFLKAAQIKLNTSDLHGLDTNPLVSDFSDEVTLHSDVSTVPNDLDIITMFQVIEHLEWPEKLFSELNNRLQVGGYLVISAPDYSGPVRFFSCTHTALPPHHLTQWNPFALKLFVEKFNYKLLAVYKEPLPDYLFASYIPQIISNLLSLNNKPVLNYRFTKYFIKPLISTLLFFKIKNLPIHGHTCLIIAQKMGQPCVE